MLLHGALRPVVRATCARRGLSMFRTVEEEVEEANQRMLGTLAIQRTSDRGWGLFAQRDLAHKARVFGARAVTVSATRDDHSVQTGWRTHALMDLPGRFINHSCTANCGILDNAAGAFDFFALRPIRAGEELLWDYEASEYESISVPVCLCGSACCRGGLKGFKVHGDVIREQYGEYYAAYLKEVI